MYDSDFDGDVGEISIDAQLQYLRRQSHQTLTLLALILEGVQSIMAQDDDLLTAVTSVEAAGVQIQADITTLLAEIANPNDPKVAAATARLTAIAAALVAADASTKAAPVPTPVAVPVAPVAPVVTPVAAAPGAPSAPAGAPIDPGAPSGAPVVPAPVAPTPAP